MGRWSVLALVLLLPLGGPAARAAEGDAIDAGSWSLIVENDFFYETDRDYTNGFAVVWLPPGLGAPAWALDLARALPWFPQTGTVRHGYSIGQTMYTPSAIHLADPPRDDRPYAGWLYGTISVGAGSERQLDQFALTVGVVGPASLAEQGQRVIHLFTGSDNPQGWDHQLHDEVGFMASYQRSWRGVADTAFDGIQYEATPHLGAALGTVHAYANAGFTVRLGQGLGRDFGPPRIQPSMPGSGFFVPKAARGWYFFFGFEGRAVARNLFLDGNTFRASRSVEKEPLVGDLQWGLAVTLSEIRLSYTHVLRSREFVGQQGHDRFGALTFSAAF